MQLEAVFSRRNSLNGFASQDELTMAWLAGKDKSLPSLEFLTRGARLGPFEDFKLRTIGAISGLWSRFLYAASLRGKDGNYFHWGHARVHGELQSQAAVARMHSELYIELLRSPIRLLAQEWTQADGRESEAELKQLIGIRDIAIPDDMAGGSPRHFNSILLTTRLLLANRQVSTPGAASQPQPLAQ